MDGDGASPVLVEGEPRAVSRPTWTLLEPGEFGSRPSTGDNRPPLPGASRAWAAIVRPSVGISVLNRRAAGGVPRADVERLGAEGDGG